MNPPLLSDIVTYEAIEDRRTHLPQLEAYRVPGAGHMVAGDRNDAFNDGVIRFLLRHMPVR